MLASCRDGDKDKGGEGQQELSHTPHPQGQGGMCHVAPTASCSPPISLTPLPSPAHLEFRGSPTMYASPVPVPVCPCRAGARLSYPAQACPAITLGTQLWRLGTLLWQHQTQPGSEGDTDTSLSPSPRCSAASLVNWESEMKHCSSGREELRTLGTPTRWDR